MKTLILKYSLGHYLLQKNKRIRKVINYLNKSGYVNCIQKHIYEYKTFYE